MCRGSLASNTIEITYKIHTIPSIYNIQEAFPFKVIHNAVLDITITIRHRAFPKKMRKIISRKRKKDEKCASIVSITVSSSHNQCIKLPFRIIFIFTRQHIKTLKKSTKLKKIKKKCIRRRNNSEIVRLSSHNFSSSFYLLVAFSSSLPSCSRCR